MNNNKIPTCPQCGQGKIPPRYGKCLTCGYVFTDLFVKRSENKTPKHGSWSMKW